MRHIARAAVISGKGRKGQGRSLIAPSDDSNAIPLTEVRGTLTAHVLGIYSRESKPLPDVCEVGYSQWVSRHSLRALATSATSSYGVTNVRVVPPPSNIWQQHLDVQRICCHNLSSEYALLVYFCAATFKCWGLYATYVTTNT